jgi:hypothetical protein
MSNSRVNKMVNLTTQGKRDTLEQEVYRIAGELGIDPSDPLMVLIREVKQGQVQSGEQVEQLGEQVDQWTQTNLQLLKLLTVKTEEAEKLAQNNSRLTAILSGLDRQLVGLQQQIKLLPNTSTQSSLAIPNGEVNPTSRNLEQAVTAIATKINSLMANLNQAQQPNARAIAQEVESSVMNWNARFYLGFTVVTVGFIGWIALMYIGELKELRGMQLYAAERAGWAMTKLERIEKALGLTE